MGHHHRRTQAWINGLEAQQQRLQTAVKTIIGHREQRHLRARVAGHQQGVMTTGPVQVAQQFQITAAQRIRLGISRLELCRLLSCGGSQHRAV